MDGHVVPMRPFHDAAPELSKDIPLIIGSVSEEGYSYHSNPTETEWRATLTKTYGPDKANRLVDAMKAANPGKAIRTLSYGVSGLAIRNGVEGMIRQKAAIGRRAGLSILVHLAVAPARRHMRRLAHVRACILLRQYKTL